MWISVTASMTRIERHRAEELAHDDLEVGERRGQQQLDRARPLLFRVGPHRDHRQHEQHEDRDVLQQRPEQLLVDVHRLRPPSRSGSSACSGARRSSGWRRRSSRRAARTGRSRCRRSARRSTTSALCARSRGCYSWAASPAGAPPASGRGAGFLGRERAGRSPRGSCASAAARAAPSRSSTTARASSRRTSCPLLALDFVADDAVAAIGFGDARDAGDALERRGRVGAGRVDLHVHRFRAAQPGREVVGRVDGDDASLVDDDDALAGLRDLGEDVRAQDDGVVAGELLDRAGASR